MLNDAAAHTFRRCEERARIPIVAERGNGRRLLQAAAVGAGAADGAGLLTAGLLDRLPRAEGMLLGVHMHGRILERIAVGGVDAHGIPLCLRAGVIHVGERGAAHEREAANLRDTGGDGDLSQRRAAVEHVHIDARQAVGQDDILKLRAAGKGVVADRRQAAGREIDAAQMRTAGKGIAADRRHTVGHDELGHDGGHLHERLAVLGVERTVALGKGGVRLVHVDGLQGVHAGQGAVAERLDRARQIDVPGLIAALKRVRADSRNAVTDLDRRDVHVRPAAQACVVIGDSALAGDGQQTGAVQLPREAAFECARVRRKGRRHEREHQAQDKQDAQKFLFHVHNSFRFRMIQSSGMGSFQTFSSRQNCASMTAICSRVA